MQTCITFDDAYRLQDFRFIQGVFNGFIYILTTSLPKCPAARIAW